MSDSAATVNSRNEIRDILPPDITKQEILSHVTFRLVNADLYPNYLKIAPHYAFLDLAALYVLVDETLEGIHTVILSNTRIELLGISEDELRRAALRNTAEKGVAAAPIDAVIEGLAGKIKIPQIKFPGPERIDAWIFGTAASPYGASILLFPEFFSDLAERLSSDLLILPSSIYEVIAIPYGGGDTEKYDRVVRLVNSSDSVGENEYLSDHCYVYLHGENTIGIPG